MQKPIPPTTKSMDRPVLPLEPRASRTKWAALLAVPILAAIALSVYAQTGPSGFVIARFWDGSAAINSLPAGTNNIGDVDVASIAAGNNNIGDVDVASLPALPAGTNNIGDVDVLTLPALPAGSNAIGTVRITAVATASNPGALVNVTTASTTLLASNASRLGGTICVDPLAAGYIHMKLGATATTANGKIYPGQCRDLPPPVYTGVIDARSSAGTLEVSVWEW